MSDDLHIKIPSPKERIIIFSKQVDQDSIGDLTKQVIEINDHDDHIQRLAAVDGLKYDRKPIRLYIDSYGGNVYQCLGFLSIMDSSKTPIHTYVTGCAMSCGFLILINGHKRFAYKYSTPLYHQISTGFFGTLAEMEIQTEEAKRLQKLINQIVSSRTKITTAKLDEIFNSNKDFYMDAKNALRLGVVDSIVS